MPGDTISTRRAPGRPDTVVLIPVFDAADKLERTLRSLDSEDSDFDVIVVDDGSVPALSLEAASRRHRLHHLRLPRNQGIARALNAGLERVVSLGYTFVARQDAGDIDHADRIGVQRQFLLEHESVALVGAWARFVDGAARERFVFKGPDGVKRIRRHMHRLPAFIHPACMMRVAVLREVGFYSDRYPCAEDYELFWRIMRRHEVANIQRVLVDTELDVTGISHRRRRQSLRSRLRIQLREFDPACYASYSGTAWTLMLMLWPCSVVDAVKSVWHPRLAVPRAK